MSAAVFALFGAAKFTAHATEVSSFRGYGLPAPDTFVYAIGTLEIVGAALLGAGLLTRLVAVTLASDMIGAIIASGLQKGELVSLALAPVLLIATLVLLWSVPATTRWTRAYARREQADEPPEYDRHSTQSSADASAITDVSADLSRRPGLGYWSVGATFLNGNPASENAAEDRSGRRRRRWPSSHVTHIRVEV